MDVKAIILVDNLETVEIVGSSSGGKQSSVAMLEVGNVKSGGDGEVICAVGKTGAVHCDGLGEAVRGESATRASSGPTAGCSITIVRGVEVTDAFRSSSWEGIIKVGAIFERATCIFARLHGNAKS